MEKYLRHEVLAKPINRKGKGVVPIRRYKDLLFISGHGPVDENGEPLMQGCVGEI